jgi:hypothetical protein
MSESDVVIRVEGLGKTTSLHHEQSERTEALQDLVLQDLARQDLALFDWIRRDLFTCC